MFSVIQYKPEKNSRLIEYLAQIRGEHKRRPRKKYLAFRGSIITSDQAKHEYFMRFGAFFPDEVNYGHVMCGSLP